MWRVTTALLGRWGTRDFLRGRSKKAGSVHIRHTHGSKGRYKRLTSMYGVRDGRRHAGNRLSGGLGIKLGGGLFGMRIPRQHLLSTLTREEADVEMYGHPNITNPYRHHLREHPALQRVLDDAPLAVELVVLLPRVSRTAATTDVVPDVWRRVMEDVRAAVDLASPHTVAVHLATLQASVYLGAHGDRNSVADSADTALARLFAVHREGRRLAPHELTTASQKPRAHTRHAVRFLGSALKTAPVTASVPAPQPGCVRATGVQELLRALRHASPDALCVCARASTPASTSAAHETTLKARPALLKKDVDQDDASGVWGLTRCNVARLVRWHCVRNDPRAHCADALPHCRRRLRVTMLLDASRAAQASTPGQRTTSLLPHRFARELLAMGFRPITQGTATETLGAMREWVADYHATRAWLRPKRATLQNKASV